MKPITIALLTLLSACAEDEKQDPYANHLLYECRVEWGRGSGTILPSVDLCTDDFEPQYEVCEGHPREDNCMAICYFVEEGCEP